MKPVKALLVADIAQKKETTNAAELVRLKDAELLEAKTILAKASGTLNGTVRGVNLEANRKQLHKVRLTKEECEALAAESMRQLTKSLKKENHPQSRQ